MLCAAVPATTDWEALAAIGSLASAFGTFAAAFVAILIWRSDKAVRQRDRHADARALSRQLLTEMQTICAVTHTMWSGLPASPAQDASLSKRYATSPQDLAKSLNIGAGLVTPRLERLSEKLGVLPAKTTDAITLFMGSAITFSNMLRTLRESAETDQESITEVLNSIRVLHSDALDLYVALAEATNIGPARVRAIVDSLRAIPPVPPDVPRDHG